MMNDLQFLKYVVQNGDDSICLIQLRSPILKLFNEIDSLEQRVHSDHIVIDIESTKLIQATELLNRATEELYNNGMSPKLLADILDFLHPTRCEVNNE
jgi:hypothetical protein